MYTFTDQGGRDLALRPEGTAGVNRAVIENGLIKMCIRDSARDAELQPGSLLVTAGLSLSLIHI